MALSRSSRDFIIEQLGRTTPVTAKRMFGGVGLYAGDLFFALIADDRLYFKVDDTTRGDFESLGAEPFRPYGDHRSMSYYEVPVNVLENNAELDQWTRRAIKVAKEAKSRKK
jgi:DNA transformation protein